MKILCSGRYFWARNSVLCIHEPIYLGKRTKIFLNYILGPALFVWLGWSIYQQLQRQPDLSNSWNTLGTSLSGSKSWMLWLAILLVSINMLIESRKWQLLALRIQPVSLMQSLRSVLLGQALAFGTPNRLGEPMGRVTILGEGNRLRGIALSLISNFSQMLTTFIAGLAGLIYLRFGIPAAAQQLNIIPAWGYNGFVLVVVALTMMMLVAYYRLAWLTRWLEKWALAAKYHYLIAELENVSSGELTRILLLSAGRYLVFVVQYVLVLQVFEVQMQALDAACMVAVMCLLLAIIPTISFAELGFRGEIGLWLFGMLSANALGIVAVTTGIWLMNLVLPAIIGGLFLLGLRLFRTKKDV